MPDVPSRAARLGALVFLLRPTYVLAEVVTAAGSIGGYSFVSDTVSRLGEVGCTDGWCSPRHEVMNGAFMVYGVMLAGGALLLAGLLATGAVTAAPAVGLVLSGEGQAAGALERLALWPVLGGLAAFAWRHAPRGTRG